MGVRPGSNRSTEKGRKDHPDGVGMYPFCGDRRRIAVQSKMIPLSRDVPSTMVRETVIVPVDDAREGAVAERHRSRNR